MSESSFNLRGRGDGRGGQRAGQPSLCNPERAQALVSRYNKYLNDGTLAEIRISYVSGGITVTARRPDVVNQEGDATSQPFVPLAVAIRDAKRARPDEGQMGGLRAAARFERRFSLPAPAKYTGEMTSDQIIEFNAEHMPFSYRRAFNLSNREFEQEFPYGFSNGIPNGDIEGKEAFICDFRAEMLSHFRRVSGDIPREIRENEEIKLLLAMPEGNTEGSAPQEEKEEILLLTPLRGAERSRIARALFPVPIGTETPAPSDEDLFPKGGNSSDVEEEE